MAAPQFPASNAAAFSNISATPAAFALYGGTYMLTAHATWGGGSVQLNRLAADGVTFVPVSSAYGTAALAKLSADGSISPIPLAPGTYQLAVATATGLYVDIAMING